MNSYYQALKKLVGRTRLGFVHFNAKTGISLDLDSKCPRKCLGNPCNYCYAEQMKERSFMKMEEKTYFTPREQWNPEAKIQFITFLESFFHLAETKSPGYTAFIRVFSKSDYKRRDKAFWRDVLTLCRQAGVRTVVITKQMAAVHDLNDLVTRVQFSIDTRPNPAFRALASGAMKKYRNMILRGVACSEADVAALDGKVGILTLFHNDAQGRGRKALQSAFPDTTRPDWKPELWQKKTKSFVCCSYKGTDSHAKCVWCGGCVA